jgi:hypothetical protein
MHEFQVSQHNECVVRLTVLEETKSPDKEHKVGQWGGGVMSGS